MKGKTLYLVYFLATILFITIMLIAKNYFAAGALVFSWLVVSYRELWSLIRFHKLPPVDERNKESINKALVNCFVLFCFVVLLTILVYSTLTPSLIRPELETYLSILFACIGIVYSLSYLFFDKLETNLSDKRKHALQICSLIAFATFIVFFINTFYANVFIHDFERWLRLYQILLIGSATIFVCSILSLLIILLITLVNRPRYDLQNREDNEDSY